MSNLTILPVVTDKEMDAEAVLQHAQSQELESVTIVGYAKDGSFFFASSHADGAPVVFDLEIGKSQIFKTIQDMSDE